MFIDEGEKILNLKKNAEVTEAITWSWSMIVTLLDEKLRKRIVICYVFSFFLEKKVSMMPQSAVAFQG